ncbi:hypothetical protein [Myxococcus sp. CA039A]|uniref:hypothetical protein n=1 Tax=Myxococcus sp. CA039A TaxID=2741737 RepID=UPI00157ADEDB|nr:hypothetical protein [Myxococcus sp. CA039A]NTX50169.1 hypothetical protein [Myxococcus sp. CA039A]
MSGFSSKSWVVLVAVGLAGCGGPESAPAVPPEVGQSEQRLLTLVSCPIGTSQTQYSPPLKRTPQDVTISTANQWSNCISLFGGVTSGVSSSLFVRQDYSCDTLVGILPVTSQVTWNTGETSTFRQTQVSTNVQGATLVILQIGTVLSGKFEGATLVRTTTLLASDLAACDSDTGLASISGPVTLTILGLL